MKTNSNGGGIDLRLSAPFVRREVMTADQLIEKINAEGETTCFAVVSLHARCLCIGLLASFEKGGGRCMLEHVAQGDRFEHPYIVLRSTTRAAGFYIRAPSRC